MTFMAFTFGAMGFMFALISYSRIDKLEKRLKQLGVLEQDFTSDEEL